MTYMTPFSRMLELSTGKFTNPDQIQTRRLSDLKGLFSDASAEAEMMRDNPVLYEVYLAFDAPPVQGQLGYSTTVIYPGQVGSEYFMTKGHYHAKGECGELYTCLHGEGYLLMQTREGQIQSIHMTPGVAAYVPPYWAHRTMNVGKDNFVFYACYPAEAGYDYGAIAEKGFASLIVERNGEAEVIANPRYK
jgi:glucose-6-phosphate isomerase, archaeal